MLGLKLFWFLEISAGAFASSMGGTQLPLKLSGAGKMFWLRNFWVALSILALAPSALAQEKIEEWRVIGGQSVVTVPRCVDRFKDLPALAERLGVQEGAGSGTFVLGMCDGRQYDFMALIGAALDRIDKATK